jgi:hypothetical protein
VSFGSYGAKNRDEVLLAWPPGDLEKTDTLGSACACRVRTLARHPWLRQEYLRSHGLTDVEVEPTIENSTSRPDYRLRADGFDVLFDVEELSMKPADGRNLVAIPVAAGVFVHWGLDLPTSVGAVAMSLSTIIVAANAQLLRRLKLQPAAV